MKGEEKWRREGEEETANSLNTEYVIDAQMLSCLDCFPVRQVGTQNLYQNSLIVSDLHAFAYLPIVTKSQSLERLERMHADVIEWALHALCSELNPAGEYIVDS